MSLFSFYRYYMFEQLNELSWKVSCFVGLDGGFRFISWLLLEFLELFSGFEWRYIRFHLLVLRPNHEQPAEKHFNITRNLNNANSRYCLSLIKIFSRQTLKLGIPLNLISEICRGQCSIYKIIKYYFLITVYSIL